MTDLINVPALAAQQWPIDSLHAYENNAKIHTDFQVSKIAGLIKRFGFDQPIVVDGVGVIIKGHGRHLAAKSLGMKFVPVIVRTDMTAKEAAASRIADNKVAEGDSDTEKLQSELADLAGSGDIDMTELGFSEKELAFMTSADLGDMDDSAVVGADDLGSSKVTETEGDMKDLATEEVSLSKILGFSKISGADAPRLTEFITTLEADTGQVGAEAFMTWVGNYLEARSEATA